MPMTSAMQRAALSALVLGFATACASSSATGHPSGGKSAPAPTQGVTAKDIEQHDGQPIEAVLQAKVPGIMVTRLADGGIAIQMRGTASSFYGSTQPLFVVDGVVFRPGPNGELVGINPYDIESIKVLRTPRRRRSTECAAATASSRSRRRSLARAEWQRWGFQGFRSLEIHRPLMPRLRGEPRFLGRE